MTLRPAVLVLLLVVPALSGCAGLDDFFARLNAPDARVQVTPMIEGVGPGAGPWNQDNRFVVRAIYEDPLEVVVEAVDLDGIVVGATATLFDATQGDDLLFTNEVELELPDGIWDIQYTVAGVPWGSLDLVHVDSTAPQVHGLELVGDGQDGTYIIGDGASQDADAQISIYRQGSSQPIGNVLPYAVTGLRDGIHVYDVVARDAAGNQNVYTVQVRAGDAKALPEGVHTAGIVARYTNTLRLWDISDPGRYDTPSQARQKAQDEPGGPFLGNGYGITPNDPDVQDIIADEVVPGMSTLDIAIALYIRLFDDFEYDESRLDETGLLQPHETIEAGGGVCRDLAALYISMLRGAGVPARLVTGYLGGENPLGFHAWVEVYAPSDLDQSPWLPVDVSPIDGRWDASTGSQGLTVGEQALLQSFGVKDPEYLQLRTLPGQAEREGWSTALSYSTSYNPGQEPTVDFAVEVTDNFEPQTKTLCVDAETYAREVNENCRGYSHIFPDHPYLVEQIMDYGLAVERSRGASFDVEAAFPFVDDVTPDSVQFVTYGPTQWTGWDADAVGDVDGKIEASFSV